MHRFLSRGFAALNAGPLDNLHILTALATAGPSVISRSLLRRLQSHSDFPLEALGAVVEVRRGLDAVERDAVATAREKGATWDDIAAAIGVTRQAAYQKYRNHSGEASSRRGRPA
jgi:hypothetical protein